jgi:hypothetical protein
MPGWPVTNRLLRIVFTVPADLTEDEVHDIGSRIVTNLVTDEPVTYDHTEVSDA